MMLRRLRIRLMYAWRYCVGYAVGLWYGFTIGAVEASKFQRVFGRPPTGEYAARIGRMAQERTIAKLHEWGMCGCTDDC